MQAARREFLRKAAITAAGVSATAAIAKEGSHASKLVGKIKKDSGKKKEVLYKRTAEWELFYKQAE